jgi:hypothetical protein
VRAFGVGLLAGSIVCTIAGVGDFVTDAATNYRARRTSRRNSRGILIEYLCELVDLLDDASPTFRRPSKAYTTWRLEQIAYLLEAGMPGLLAAHDTRTNEWIRERCVGAAEAVRHMKRFVLSPAGRSNARLVRQLRQQLAAVSTDNWMNCIYLPPPVKNSGTWKSRLVSITRVLTIACLPGLALAAIAPWIDFREDIESWARIVALAWGVLTVIWALDPAIRDKIEVVQGVATSVRDIGVKGKGASSAADKSD